MKSSALAQSVTRLILAILVLVTGIMAEYRYQIVNLISEKTGFNPIASQSKPINQQNYQTLSVNPKDVDLTQLWESWSYLQNDYLNSDSIDQAKMVDGATKGMVAALGDPYTIYLSAEENKRSGEDLAGAFYGVGIELGYKNNTLAVVAPLPGTPADLAGIQAGDLILKVKDPGRNFEEETNGWSLDKAISEIRGQKDSVVTLTLYRDSNGSEPFDVDVVRGEIKVSSVELEFVETHDGEFAHLKLIRFGERTMAEWNQAVEQILAKKAQVKGILLDVRNDPGGYFEVAIDVASDFIQSGVVVTQKGKYSTKDYPARGEARLAHIPVVVLVNQGSASASEIVAGALRDQLGAKLIGTQTFGKGTVQDRRELSGGGGLHVTIARWLLPGGAWINDEGMKVDEEVQDDPETDTDEVVLKAIEVLQKNKGG